MQPDYGELEGAADLGLGYPPADCTDDLVGAVIETAPEVAASEAEKKSNPTHQVGERTMSNDTESTCRRTPRDPYHLNDFVAALGYVDALPTEAGEYADDVTSSWIGDVIAPGSDDCPDPNMSVEVNRLGNNQAGYDAPVLSYEISVAWTRGGLFMTPEAAIEMGRYLLEAASWAVGDRARHTDWLLCSGGETE